MRPAVENPQQIFIGILKKQLSGVDFVNGIYW